MNIRLSIGANLGRRAATLREAIRRLAGLPGTRLLAASSFYETAPWGNLDQPPFLNGAVLLETTLVPEALLNETQAIEQALGRVRHEHWGARTIDIDLVYATETADGQADSGERQATRIVRRISSCARRRSFTQTSIEAMCSRMRSRGCRLQWRPVRRRSSLWRGRPTRRHFERSAPRR